MLTGLRGRGPGLDRARPVRPVARTGSYVVRVWCGDDHVAADAARVRARRRVRRRGLRLRLRRPAVPRRRDDPGRRHLPRGGGRRRARRGVLGRPLAADLQARDGRRGPRPRLRPARARPAATASATRASRPSRASTCSTPTRSGPGRSPTSASCTTATSRTTTSSRRLYEMKGHRFFTGNDSELLALYLAHRLEEGATIQEAMEASIRDLDGAFSYLLATPDGLGMCRDRVGSMPGIVAETDDWVGGRVGADRRPPGVRRGGRAGVVPRARRGEGGDVDAVVDCAGQTTREINRALKRLAAEGAPRDPRAASRRPALPRRRDVRPRQDPLRGLGRLPLLHARRRRRLRGDGRGRLVDRGRHARRLGARPRRRRHQRRRRR